MNTPDLRTHANTRCDTCGEFGLPPYKRRHEHCKPRPLECSRCGQTYDRVHDLIAHHRPDDEGKTMCERIQQAYPQ